MSDQLAVLQTEESIKQIKKLRAELPGLSSDIKDVTSSVNSFNRNLRSGNLQKYAETMQNATEISRKFNQIHQQISKQMEQMSRIERNNAQAAAENARARRETAAAARLEVQARERAERQAAKEAKQNNESAGAYKRLSQEANKVKTTTKNLEAEILILTRDFKTGVISQERYNQELAKLQGQFSAASSRAKQLDVDLKRIDANVGDRQRNVGNYRDAAMGAVKALNSQITTMIASYAGFHAIVNGTTSLVHNNYELSDSLADLQIRLNGNKDATDKLFESLKKIDTRTSLGELVNTASLVAKKGVAADEIEGITKALDNYFITAGKEAGSREEGTASIIKLISIFNEDKHVTAERVTEISTALVKLQNSGVATGSKMIDIAERIGAVKGMTGITLPQVLGFAAAIEQLGQKSEVAGTAGMQILTKLLSNMPAYAKIAGVSVKELRKAYTNDPFEAVLMVTKGAMKTGDKERIIQDLEEVGVRGSRVKGVLGDIAANADFVRKRIKEAGMAMNQEGYLAETAAKKQETFAATVDKIKKEFELLGASEGFRNFLSNSSKLLLGFIKILTSIPFGLVIGGLTLLTAAWAYYKGMMIQATITAQWNNSQSLLGSIRNKAARLGLLGEAEAMRAHTIQTNANSMARGLNIASLESQIAAERAAIATLEAKYAVTEAEYVATQQQIAAKYALITALEAEVVATEEATAATAGLNTATKASPLGIILSVLAVFVPLLITYTEKTDVAAKKVRTLAENQEDLNKALDKGVQNAAEEVSHLDELYKKYTDVNTSTNERKEIIKEWQDYYPSYFGALKSEKDLNDKLTGSYLELRDAIVSASRADAIRDKLKGRASERLTRDEQLTRDTQKETELNKKIKANSKVGEVKKMRVDGGDGKSFTIEIESTDLLKASDQRLKNLQKTRSNNQKADNQEDKILLDMLQAEDKKAEKLRKDRESRLGKYARNEDEDKKKEKPYTGAKLTGEQKDALNTIQSIRDNQIAEQKEKLINLQIDQKTYWENYLKIIQEYRKKIEDYLKGSNAKEKQIEAAARRKAIEELERATDEIYNIYKSGYEERYKMLSGDLQGQQKVIESSDYFSDVERLNKQIELDNEMIKQAESYYAQQIELAKNAAKDTLEWERKRDEEINKYIDARADRYSSMFEAQTKDVEKQADYAKVFQSLTAEERKALILSNKRLTNAERERALRLDDIATSIEDNDIQIKKLENLKSQLQIKIALAQINGLISPEDIKSLTDLEAQIIALKNANAELHKGAKDDVAESTQAIRDIIENGFRNLGFNYLADAYAATMERLKNDTASWKDYALLAFAAIGDAMSNLSTKEKEHRIKALDEQLKKSQQTTDQELGFINQRLEWLNNLDNISKEQSDERNRLENEARAYKDQRFQREKLIEIQKAKAEQRAASEQALINGALAATTTLAKTGFTVKGIIQAGLALAFGVAQAISINSKNPIPQYWVGTMNAKPGLAWRDERGAEIHTDKNDVIKSYGDNSGAKLVQMEAGDKVYTADQTKNILRNYKELPKPGSKLLRNAALKALRGPVVNLTVQNKSVDYSEAVAKKVGEEVARQLSRFDKPSQIKINGVIYTYRGAQYPQITGYYDPNTGLEISKEQYLKIKNGSN